MTSKRTKALAIPMSVKRKVYDRDSGRCIFCGEKGDPVAHYIPRSHGGLGIEENIITACGDCHRAMDQTTHRAEYMVLAKEYLEMFYPDFSDNDRIYRR